VASGVTEREDEPSPPASPACNAREAPDAYMGFASPEEIADFLADLAARERAGVPVDDVVRAMLPRVRDDRLHAELASRLGTAKET
jgi:hypothetical protein